MERIRRIAPVLVFAIAALIAVAPTIASADSAAVAIRDGGNPTTWGYGPNSTTVSVGQSVTFTNTGTSPHDATATDGSWGTPLLQSGSSASITFSTPGTFNYTCVLHPWMTGSIIVTPAASAPAPAAPTVDISAPAPATTTNDVAPPANPAPQSDGTATQPVDDSTATGTGAGSN